MAKCIKCGKKGLFLHIDKRGLCEECAQIRLADLYKAANDIQANALVLNIPKRQSEQVVMKMVIESINNSIRILSDSANIVEKTKNPETFYSRRNELYKHADRLMRFEQVDPSLFKGMKPSEMAQKMYGELEQGEAELWERCYVNAIEKADKLKTEKGRLNAINKYFDMVKQYEKVLSPKARRLVQNQRDRHIQALNE